MLDLQQASNHLGMTTSGLRKLVSAGKITYFQDGKHARIRFKQEWLDAYINEHTHKPQEETKKARCKRHRAFNGDLGGSVLDPDLLSL